MAPTSYGFAKIKSNMKFNCYVVSGKSSLQKVTAATKLEDSWLLGRKAMTNLDIVLKSKSITFPTKVHIVKAMVFLLEKATAAHSSTLAWKIPRTEELF